MRGSFTTEKLEDDVDLATLYLVQASVADYSARAMPYPEFVARGWAVSNITNYHPFDRLGLWCAYMDKFSSRSSPSDLGSIITSAKRVRSALMETFNVVDNPIRFPLLEPVGLIVSLLYSVAGQSQAQWLWERTCFLVVRAWECRTALVTAASCRSPSMRPSC